MTRSPNPIPLKPDYSGRSRPAIHLTRAAFAHAKGLLEGQSPGDVCKNLWPGDDVTATVTRGTTTPATTATSGWASQLAQTSVTGDFVASLAPLSAAAQVFAGAL